MISSLKLDFPHQGKYDVLAGWVAVPCSARCIVVGVNVPKNTQLNILYSVWKQITPLSQVDCLGRFYSTEWILQ